MSLKCGAHIELAKCTWTRDGFSLGTSRDMNSFHRYSINEDHQRQCNLQINPVLPIDEGVYRCQDKVNLILSSPIALNVNSNPGTPYIKEALENDVLAYQGHEFVTLHCESSGGKPPAEIQWQDGEGDPIVGNVEEKVLRMDDSSAFRTISKIKFKPKANVFVQCKAFNSVFQEGRFSSQVEVRIRGKASFEVKQVKAGKSFQIKCEDKGKLNIKKYIWSFDGNILSEETANVLQVENFSDNYDGSQVKCFSENQSRERKLIKTTELRISKTKNESSKSNLQWFLFSALMCDI